MVCAQKFYEYMKQAGIGLFAGVPDSVLSSFCAYLEDHSYKDEHVITANEGNAIALIAGYHLTSGNYGAVYMQNSGLGNAINPLASLADREVYRVPMLLIIGWRGEPGAKDEPQHVKQGRITPSQLDLLEIPYWVVEAESDAQALLDKAMSMMRTSGAPVALLVRKGTFSKYKTPQKILVESKLKREAALRKLLELMGDALVISTTGKTSRELFELRVEREEIQRDFMTVGAMGHASSIALGAALGNPERRVVCIDGDGAALMHLGAMPVIGNQKPKNFLHVLLNNSAHESVGGQPTVAGKMDFKAIALASGYRSYFQAIEEKDIDMAWKTLNEEEGPVLLEIKIIMGSRADLGRPTSTPEKNKRAFMQAAGL